ncbi:MAG: chloramphenicol acetyltransferase [Anaerolineales bacterium]|nr:chloramphenicol acetyltransferase [Anaerolineales bacterium]
MRIINLDTWPRRQHFQLFNQFDYPHFNLCANVDITQWYTAVKANNLNFTIATVYLLARVANEITPFRWRIREGQVIEHDIVHPSHTITTESDLFSFCTIPYDPDFTIFAPRAATTIAHFTQNPTLEDEPGQDNLLYLSAIPWVSFTGLMHPIHMHPVDSVPRIVWGKFFRNGDQWQMPLSVQAHHALLDGFHVGQYFNQVQTYLDEPQQLF